MEFLDYSDEEDGIDVSPPPPPPPLPSDAHQTNVPPPVPPPPPRHENAGVLVLAAPVTGNGAGAEAGSSASIAAVDTTRTCAYPYLDELPAAVTEGVKPETLVLLGQYLEAQREYAFDLTKSIQSKKDFGNPAILRKVVAYFQIDELGSNYPPHLFDPREIADRNKEPPAAPRPSGAPVRFVQGAPEPEIADHFQNHKKPPSLDEGKRKKSRWA